MSSEEEEKIIKTFTLKEVIEGFSVLVSDEELEIRNYSFSAGQYFEIKIKYVDITQEEFDEKLKVLKTT